MARMWARRPEVTSGCHACQSTMSQLYRLHHYPGPERRSQNTFPLCVNLSVCLSVNTSFSFTFLHLFSIQVCCNFPCFFWSLLSLWTWKTQGHLGLDNHAIPPAPFTWSSSPSLKIFFLFSGIQDPLSEIACLLRNWKYSLFIDAVTISFLVLPSQRSNPLPGRLGLVTSDQAHTGNRRRAVCWIIVPDYYMLGARSGMPSGYHFADPL